jgi:hypothetical protein
MLLLGICQRLLQKPDLEVISDDLRSVSENFEMLAHVSESSASALRFFRVLEPLYLRIRKITQDCARKSCLRSSSPMNVYSILNHTADFSPTLVVALMGELVNALNFHDIMGCD